MPQLSFDHIHYRYTDIEKTRHFYVDIMGAIELDVVYLNEKPNLQFALGGTILLFAYTDDPPETENTAKDRLGVYHIAYLVDDCQAATDYYENKGAEVAMCPFKANDQIMASFLQAPDGMWVELKQIIRTE